MDSEGQLLPKPVNGFRLKLFLKHKFHDVDVHLVGTLVKVFLSIKSHDVVHANQEINHIIIDMLFDVKCHIITCVNPIYASLNYWWQPRFLNCFLLHFLRKGIHRA